MLVVDVLDQATLLELGQLQPSGQSAVLLPSPLAVHQQAEPLFEAQLAGIGALILFTEGLGHAVQLHGLQFLHRRLIQHVSLLVGGDCSTATAKWAADRNTWRRECCHAAGRASRLPVRVPFAGRAIVSESISDSGRNARAAAGRVGWPPPGAPGCKSWPS